MRNGNDWRQRTRSLDAELTAFLDGELSETQQTVSRWRPGVATAAGLVIFILGVSLGILGVSLGL